MPPPIATFDYGRLAIRRHTQHFKCIIPALSCSDHALQSFVVTPDYSLSGHYDPSAIKSKAVSSRGILVDFQGTSWTSFDQRTRATAKPHQTPSRFQGLGHKKSADESTPQAPRRHDIARSCRHTSKPPTPSRPSRPSVASGRGKIRRRCWYGDHPTRGNVRRYHLYRPANPTPAHVLAGLWRAL